MAETDRTSSRDPQRTSRRELRVSSGRWPRTSIASTGSRLFHKPRPLRRSKRATPKTPRQTSARAPAVFQADVVSCRDAGPGPGCVTGRFNGRSVAAVMGSVCGECPSSRLRTNGGGQSASTEIGPSSAKRVPATVAQRTNANTSLAPRRYRTACMFLDLMKTTWRLGHALGEVSCSERRMSGEPEAMIWKEL